MINLQSIGEKEANEKDYQRAVTQDLTQPSVDVSIFFVHLAYNRCSNRQPRSHCLAILGRK